MTCPRTDQLLKDLEGARGQEVVFEAEQHLDSCEECQRQVVTEFALRSVYAKEGLSSASACPALEELLSFSEPGELPEQQRREISAHLRECDACAFSVARQRRWLRSPSSSFPTTPETLKEKARRQLSSLESGKPATHGSGEQSPSHPIWTRTRVFLLLTGVTVVAALLMAGLLLQEPLTPKVGNDNSTERSAPAGNLESTAPKKQPPIQASFRYQRETMPRATDLEVPFSDTPILSSNDSYGIQVRVTKKGWLYVFQIDSRDTVSALFPNESYTSTVNPLDAGNSYWFPSEEERYYLDDNTGTEQIQLIFAPQPISILETGPSRETLEQIRAQSGTNTATTTLFFSFEHQSR